MSVDELFAELAAQQPVINNSEAQHLVATAGDPRTLELAIDELLGDDELDLLHE